MNDPLFEGILWVARDGKEISLLDCIGRGNRHAVRSSIRGDFVQYEVDYDALSDEEPVNIRTRVRKKMRECGFTARKEVRAGKVSITNERGVIVKCTMRITVRIYVDRQTMFL